MTGVLVGSSLNPGLENVDAYLWIKKPGELMAQLVMATVAITIPSDFIQENLI